MMKKTFVCSVLMLPLLLSVRMMSAEAHGAQIRHRKGVAVEARYDTGEPMADAQVAVFAPGQPETPVLTGTTDGDGLFWFVPEADSAGDVTPGLWDVQVRLAGHGALLKVPISAEQRGQSATGRSGDSDAVTPLQRMVMGAVGIWGFVGTALFFSRRSSQAAGAPSPGAAVAPPMQSPLVVHTPLTDDSHAHS